MSRISLLSAAFLSCLTPVLAHAAVGGAEWLVRFDRNLTVEDARRVSSDGKMPEGSLPFNLGTKNAYTDLARLIGKYTLEDRAVVFCTIESERDEDRLIGAGCDWWLTCFINGEQIGTTEPDGNGDGLITPYRNIYKAHLKQGTNLVALYLRPGLLSWGFSFRILPDFSDWPEAANERKMLFERMYPANAEVRLAGGPIVSKVSTRSATISLMFNLPAAVCLRFWEKGKFKTTVQERWTMNCGVKDLRKVHRFELDSLTPETVYSYETLLLKEETAENVICGSGEFTTFPLNGTEHSFAVFSDTQVCDGDRIKFLTNCRDNGLLNGAFYVSLGDMASGFDDFCQAYFTSSLNLLKYPAQKNTFVPVRGNHEFRGKEIGLYSEVFGRPYYHFSFGDTIYIVLDTGEDKPVVNKPNHYTLRHDFDVYFKEQAAWLKALSETDEFRNAKHRIILAHCTPFDFIDRYMAPNMKAIAGPLFYGENAPYKLDLWICGHTHIPAYYDGVTKERTSLLNPADVRKLSGADDIGFPVYINDGAFDTTARLSVMLVDVAPDAIRIRFCREDGAVQSTIRIPYGKAIEKLK